MALELVPTLVDMLGSDIPQGIVRQIRGGVFECLSSCFGMVHRARIRWQNRVRANVDYLFRFLSSTKLGLMVSVIELGPWVESGWCYGPHC